MTKRFLFVPLLLVACSVLAQPTRRFADHTHFWLMYFGDHKVSKKWGVHLEAQLRRADVLSSPQQLLLRTGVNYHASDAVFFTGGYCYVATYPYGDLPAKSTFPEHRLWEQMQVRTPLGRVEWVSRFRLEQRFVHAPVLNPADNSYGPGDAVYSNRFRTLNRFSIPLGGKTIEERSFYLTAYDEIFVNFGRNVGANFFDQNRAYVAIGYRIPKLGRLEAGFLEQTVFKADGFSIERNHTLQLGLSSTLPFYRP